MFKLNLFKYAVVLTAILSQTAMADDSAESGSYLGKAKQVADNVWIGPQPTEQDYSELAAEEVGAIINTRTKTEMEQIPFSSVEQASSYNMTYDLLEIGQGHAYSPSKLAAFNELMTANQGKKMVLHCRSGNRATQLYTAWLIKHQGKSAADALKAVGSDETELNDSVKTLLGQ